MPNTNSEKKSAKKNKKQNLRNRQVKSQVKTAIKKAKAAILNHDVKVKELIANAHKQINVAVSKGIIHKNNGARKMSRLDDFANKHWSKLDVKDEQSNS